MATVSIKIQIFSREYIMYSLQLVLVLISDYRIFLQSFFFSIRILTDLDPEIIVLFTVT